MTRTSGIIPAIALLALVSGTLSAQISEIPLDQRIDAAALIVEGRVDTATPFWGPDGTRIFTAYRLRVGRVLKRGSRDAADFGTIEFVTPGGRIGNRLDVVTPSLHPVAGETGLFFLREETGYAGRDRAWVPYASVQGFVRYGPEHAHDPFRRYDDPQADLADAVARRTGEGAVVLDLQSSTPPRVQGGLTITGFSPSVVRAGIQEVLTIDGSGFGNLAGTAGVLFDGADDGQFGPSGPADPEHILSWTDTQIQVLVPNRNGSVTAGTGRFIVRGETGAFQQSPTILTVEYALREIRDSGALYRLNLIDEDRRGGYTFAYSTSTANGGVDITTIPGAVERIEESVAQWNCEAGWNGTVDGTTTVASTGNDGVNILAFDNASDALPVGILGRTSSFFNGCGGDSWHLDGVDIRFRRDGTGGTNWYYGADPAGVSGSETDFGSVALHELGHALQLGHVNETTDLMYFSLPTGADNRVISAASLAGAADVTGHSAPFSSCGLEGLEPRDCLATPRTDFVADPLGTCGTSASVDFTDTSRDGPTSWFWTFGDTTSSTERNPSHAYGSSGRYSVSLWSSNEFGADLELKENLIVITGAPQPASCDPTFPGHDDCCSIGIFRVALNTIDHFTLSPSEGDPLEEDFTCSQFTVLETGQTYPISVLTGPGNTENVRAYIDWDGDDILEPAELVLDSVNASLHVADVTVPASAVKDTALRMRVLSDWAARAVTGPCETIEFGQVENYSVVVSDPAPPAPGEVPPTLTLAKNSTDRSKLDFDWEPSCLPGANNYGIHEGALGAWYSHTKGDCGTAGQTELSGYSPDPGNRYFLVVPINATVEGGYGADSAGDPRPAASVTCRATLDFTSCP